MARHVKQSFDVPCNYEGTEEEETKGFCYAFTTDLGSIPFHALRHRLQMPFEADHKEQEEKSLFVWLVGPLCQ